MPMTNIPDLETVKSYFKKCIEAHGASPLGVDWNSVSSQETRFEQLLKICDPSISFSILDYGCGYGALADALVNKGFQADYYGFDIVEKMLTTAREHHAGKPNRTFLSDSSALPVCDYVVASGIFNFRAQISFEDWTEFIITNLHHFDDLSRKGFSSNFLTKYSDTDHMRADLYYADPCFLFDYCKRNFSKNVSLLHDYTIYDFTILVRKG
jgi:SAM-dependent methyltransferase